VIERLTPVAVTGEGLLAAISSFPKFLSSLSLQNNPEVTVRRLVIPAIQCGLDQGREFVFANQSAFRESIHSVDAGLVGQVQELIGEDLAGDDELLIEGRKTLRKALGLPVFERPVVVGADERKVDSGNEAK
jgi:hypothetical protein